MPIYRRKTKHFEAFKWTGCPLQEDDPVWIVRALKSGQAMITGAGSKDACMVIQLHGIIMVATTGDYIMREHNGDIRTFPASLFEDYYEEVVNVD